MTFLENFQFKLNSKKHYNHNKLYKYRTKSLHYIYTYKIYHVLSCTSQRTFMYSR